MRLTASDFSGRWVLGRDIVERQTGQTSQTGRFDGQAVFKLTDSSSLRYHEQGHLRLGHAAPLVATRSYLWQFDLGTVHVNFDDGRPFHSFTNGVSGAGTAHLCGDDLYTVTYDFGSWPLWFAHWDVQGPRKDYALHSRYHRAAGG